MARPRRELTEAERTRPCRLCGASPGERCRNPGGKLYSGAHAARVGRSARRAPPSPAPKRQYRVSLCGTCLHPGGQHIIGTGCRLCRDCPGWDEARSVPGMWSDQETDELLAAAKAGGEGSA